MDSNNKEDSSEKDFENVVDALHSKQKLPSLRTYQGDMAEFIKEKNESVFSIAVKEKKRKEEEEKEKKKEEEKIETKSEVKTGIKTDIKIEEKEKAFHKPKKKAYQMNVVVIFSSLLLITLGIFASLYVFKFINKEQTNRGIIIETEIVPYNNSIILSNMTKEGLGPEISKISPSNGISVIKISDTSGSIFKKAADFFNFLEISLPGGLERTLKDRYMIGIISQDKEISPFVVITVNDFGSAFSSMLEWEANIEKDFSFLTIAPTIATSTASTTPPSVQTNKKGPFVWKDIIIKNKDTRGLVNQKNQAQIAYTFLDKNTILITNSLSSIGEISSIYASRSVVR